MLMFTPIPALFGGALIGAAASLLWLTHGRRAGISGLLGGVLSSTGDDGERSSFLLGLSAVGLFAAVIAPTSIGPMTGSLPLLALAGMLTGFGTRLGGGCTSGHGVCGLSRASGRSLAATLLFMFVAAVTVFASRHLVGGST